MCLFPIQSQANFTSTNTFPYTHKKKINIVWCLLLTRTVLWAKYWTRMMCFKKRNLKIGSWSTCKLFSFIFLSPFLLLAFVVIAVWCISLGQYLNILNEYFPFFFFWNNNHCRFDLVGAQQCNLCPVRKLAVVKK